jgi:predicted ATPase
MDATIRARVRDRAGHCCEYCRIHQQHYLITFYVFKHALIQEAAYQSLLRSTRQQYHQRIAQMVEERFSEISETQPALLAHHYTKAVVLVLAIPYWQRSGQRAIECSAHMEAISHLSKGLELLATLLDTAERTQHELTLQTTLGDSLMTIKGFAAPEVERVYSRPRALCWQVGARIGVSK